MTDSPAMIAALAEIEAMSARNEARRARIEADARVVFLTQLCASLRTEITGYGHEGFMQIAFGSVAPEAWRRRRAVRLLNARRAQFTGGKIGRLLEDAAMFRQFEKANQTIAEIAPEGNRSASLNDVTALVCDDVLRSMRRSA